MLGSGDVLVRVLPLRAVAVAVAGEMGELTELLEPRDRDEQIVALGRASEHCQLDAGSCEGESVGSDPLIECGGQNWYCRHVTLLVKVPRIT